MQGRYEGRERRRHQMYVTRNTEYHFRDQTCVAVRDRRTGSFLTAHLALHRDLTGGVRFFVNGYAIPTLEPPRPGEALYFGRNGRDLVTSVLSSVERPEKSVVDAYPGVA